MIVKNYQTVNSFNKNLSCIIRCAVLEMKNKMEDYAKSINLDSEEIITKNSLGLMKYCYENIFYEIQQKLDSHKYLIDNIINTQIKIIDIIEKRNKELGRKKDDWTTTVLL